MSFLKAAARSPLDLTSTRVTQPDASCLMAVSDRTALVWVLVAVFAVVAAFGFMQIWRARGLTGWTAIAPIFGLIAVVFAFGEHRKIFYRAQDRAVVTAWLGALSSREEFPLARAGKIVLSLRVERGSSIETSAKVTRWYDVSVAGQPALGFTVAGDRDAARAFAKRLAGVLKYAVEDGVEDDGIQRLPPNAGF